MKEGIHPEVFDCEVRCFCGAKFQMKSTKKEITVDTCSKCHPFYTGKQKLINPDGEIEKFKRKYEKYYNKNGQENE